jgi:hypothetical protein
MVVQHQVGPDTSPFRDGEWMEGEYSNIREGVVQSVSAGEVTVVWSSLIPCHDEGNNETENDDHANIPPPDLCDASSLRALNHFSNTWWNIGDRALFRPSSSPLVDDFGLTISGAVVGIETFLDIQAQDTGEVRRGVPAIDLCLHNPGPHQLFPNDIVQRRDEDDNSSSRDDNRRGVVVSVDGQNRMCRVRWLPQSWLRTRNGDHDGWETSSDDDNVHEVDNTDGEHCDANARDVVESDLDSGEEEEEEEVQMWRWSLKGYRWSSLHPRRGWRRVCLICSLV